eukprot:5975394-Ditylum_brightwellii.AAC.1
MPICAGKTAIDKARVPCNCRALCICILKSKPIKHDDSLRATNCIKIPWVMTGETMMRIVREYKCIGVADALPYTNFQWTMDNWFASKLICNELLWPGQYPLGTMEVKRYVPPYLKHGKIKNINYKCVKGNSQSSTFSKWEINSFVIHGQLVTVYFRSKI